MAKNNQNDPEFELEENLEDHVPENSSLSDKLKKLREELKICQADKTEYLAGWQRAKADYLNLKRQGEEDKKLTSQWVKEGILSDLLTIADSFELAFGNKEAWEQAPENWRKGIEYIYNQLQNIFRDHKLEEINPPIDTNFNPQEHDPIATVETGKPEEDDKIIEIIKKGYKLNEKIIRPASVKVKHYKD